MCLLAIAAISKERVSQDARFNRERELEGSSYIHSQIGPGERGNRSPGFGAGQDSGVLKFGTCGTRSRLAFRWPAVVTRGIPGTPGFPCTPVVSFRLAVWILSVWHGELLFAVSIVLANIGISRVFPAKINLLTHRRTYRDPAAFALRWDSGCSPVFPDPASAACALIPLASPVNFSFVSFSSSSVFSRRVTAACWPRMVA